MIQYSEKAYDNNSWNIRDTHMMETLNRLLAFHGRDAKAIVWEHNTHIGDARATGMSRAGMVNIGQLASNMERKKCTCQGLLVTKVQ